MTPAIRRSIASLAVAALGATPAANGEQADEPPIVSAAAPEPGDVPSAEFIDEIYAVAERGGRLYDAGRYAEAVPYLAAAAEHGFKVPQASLGDILLNGRGGVARDTPAGIGWLGVAAEAQTLPRIETYFGQVLDQLPVDYKPTAQQIVDAYRSAYGHRQHRVECRLLGEIVKDLQCHFIDEPDDEEDTSDIVEAYAGVVEEMVVVAPIITAPAPELGQIPSGTFISQVYEAASRGAELYRQKRYKEALPFLVIAAKRGFKRAQASAADIYLRGLGGVPVDLEAGIGWLGVAAEPRTTNSIIEFYKESRALLPERYTPEAVDQIVSNYRSEYGSLNHRVACRHQPVDSTWSMRLKTLRCHFIDEATQCREASLDGEELGWYWTCQPIEGSRARDARPY